MWIPTIDHNSDQKLYQQISDAIVQAILNGELKRGEQLPTVRALASALHVTPGTINRAFDEVAGKGLLDKTQGKGTFVKAQKKARNISVTMVEGRNDVYDFTVNQPAQLDIDPLISRHVKAIAESANSALWSQYGDTRGWLSHREVLAGWLNERGTEVDPAHLFLLNGAQQGLLSSLMLLCEKGDTVMVQETTFSGIRSIATLLDLNLHPVAMDDEGFDVNHFRQLCKHATSQVLAILPTAHNPTGKTLSLARREKLVKIARKYDIFIVEDDLYLHHRPVTPLQALAPERTFYVSGMSKRIAPALRVGTLITPPQYTDAMTRIVQAQSWVMPSMMMEIAARLITSGDAAEIEHARRHDIETRLALAKRTLGEKRMQYDPANQHLWVKHSPRLENAEVIARLNQLGVDALPSVFFHITQKPSPHIRLCLGNMPLKKLETGLEIIAKALNPSLPERSII
ncbi:PLP-dependent aminotransferase family protein [Aestuariibacter sp. A3R04]|uniref:aminotransferase-like domain-containing protein n=1 Tax=Aestuariibacter sp. A3R04 TaxID=2841571 RepID=UPI001C090B4C|nr:PLP-dependent aminotransferase family protein [Aestuariibacter sp. A3R04]MBU3023438.1 PLP-dependent aminotransferase family protein [Aestuariibacter sp. A3R04]